METSTPYRVDTPAPMKYKEVRYQRVKNLGNYESERMELVAEVAEGDDIGSAIASLKERVERSLFPEDFEMRPVSFEEPEEVAF